MKKPIISVLLIGGVILASANSVSAGDYTTHYDNKQEAVDWNAKKLEAQMKSTQMRKEKYEMYKAKGYDVSSLTSDLLDGTKTDEGQFWNQIKSITNNHELPMRKARIAEAQKSGMDTSMFTDEVMNDSGKFWDTWKREIEPKKQAKMEADQKQWAEKKEQEKQWVEQKKYQESKNDREGMYQKNLPKSQEPIMGVPSQNPIQDIKQIPVAEIKQVRSLTETARKKFIKTLEAVADEKRTTTYESMKKKIANQMEVAKKKKLRKTYAKLVEMDQLLEQYLGDDEMDDEMLIDEMTR